MKKTILLSAVVILALSGWPQKKKTETNTNERYGVAKAGTEIIIQFDKGIAHNHPLFAIWLADAEGKFIQTLYVSESIGRGVFRRASRSTGKWQAGEIQRPASLPYWAHQRGMKNEFGNFLPSPQQPEVDAYTGATPHSSFVMYTKTEKPLNGKFRVMLELNQSWDWNEWWTNDRFPGNKDYKTSSQPAIVYEADIDTQNPAQEHVMKPIGHSHYAGADGSLTRDLSTLTTALKIARRITVKIGVE